MRHRLRRVKSGDPFPGALGKIGFKTEVLTWGKKPLTVVPMLDLCPTLEKAWGKLRGRK